MEIGYYTDKGKKRTQNEDAIRVLTRHNGRNSRKFLWIPHCCAVCTYGTESFLG